MEKKELNKSEFYDVALSFAIVFVQKTMKLFTSEDVKEEFYKTYNEPFEPRIWGPVFRELSRQGKIFFKGYVKYKNPKGHGKPTAQWISLEYHLKQSKNRQSNGRSQQSLF